MYFSEVENHFNINFLDHVAIRVEDMEVSAKWYNEVLGLKKHHLPEWGVYPIMMMSGQTGIAIFPANLEDDAISRMSRNVKIDHFAFNVNRENFERAQLKFKNLNIPFSIQDHIHFDSLYLKDPDGHVVELTTFKGDKELFNP